MDLTEQSITSGFRSQTEQPARRYCMPPDGISCLPMREILTYEEIEHLAVFSQTLASIKSRLPGESLSSERIYAI